MACLTSEEFRVGGNEPATVKSDFLLKNGLDHIVGLYGAVDDRLDFGWGHRLVEDCLLLPDYSHSQLTH